MKYVRGFETINKNNVSLAGGKGASLGEMTQTGIPVPEGFVILADAFEYFLEKTDLNVEIDAALDEVDIEEVHTVEEASEKINAMILDKKIPIEIAKEIIEEFRKLNVKFVAVRSSATSEDSSTAAWAGQLETYLNTTKKNLLENVKKCWASLFTPRAIFYRFEQKLDGKKISVAVVVQKMIESEESGVAFSVHPVTQDKNQIIIEGGYGLGEAIVSGQITPDSYVIDKENWKILDKNVNVQLKGLYRAEKGGNEWKEIPEEKAKRQVLSDKEIIELAKLIVKIEKHYGFPVDVEWAKEKEKFYITQSRPITTLQKAADKLDKFSKYEFKVVAKDFNSPLIQNYIWTKGVQRHNREFGISQVIIGIASKENQVEYIGDLNSWTHAHEDFKKKIDKDMYLIEKIIDKTNEMGEEFTKWSEKNIFKKELSRLSNEKLISLLKEFIEKNSMLGTYGTILPLIDFGEFSFVEGNLKKFLIEKVGEKKYPKYFEVFTEPLHNSFAMNQEEDILRLMIEFYNKKWIEDIKTKNLKELKKIYSKFYEKLEEHTKKHSWIYYVYIGPSFTEQNFLDFIKDYLNKNINPKEELEKMKNKKEEIAKLKKKYIQELKPDKFNKMILNLAGKIVWAKPRRKDYQSKLNYHSENLMKEIARRLKISLNEARSIPPELFDTALKEGKIDRIIPDSTYKFHICIPDEDKIEILWDEEAKQFYEKYVKKEEVKVENVVEIKGTTANRGKATGIVKIINSPADMDKMNRGDILVSVATTPNIVPAMRIASAIVTDEGGLTCHAAIVSREFNIPCVVGTKIATKILNDEDLVEVDADKGIVKILKKVK